MSYRDFKKRLFTVIGIMVLLVSLLPINVFATAQANHSSSDQHQLIPMYIYPFWWQAGNDWYRVCDSMNASGQGSTAIMNPDNGPGTSHNSDYDYVIDRCHDAGNNVIGYVDTSYTAVPIETVKANIDKYYQWYNTQTSEFDTHIDGIFVDQISNEVSTAGYYYEIYTYIKSKSITHSDVVGNAGAPAATDWQLNADGPTPTQAADAVVIFEGPRTGTYGLSTFVKPAWVDNYPASKIAMMVYDVSHSKIGPVCRILKNSNAGLVDVTNYTITSSATPWNFLQSPAYWRTFTNYC